MISLSFTLQHRRLRVQSSASAGAFIVMLRQISEPLHANAAVVQERAAGRLLPVHEGQAAVDTISAISTVGVRVGVDGGVGGGEGGGVGQAIGAYSWVANVQQAGVSLGLGFGVGLSLPAAGNDGGTVGISGGVAVAVTGGDGGKGGVGGGIGSRHHGVTQGEATVDNAGVSLSLWLGLGLWVSRSFPTAGQGGGGEGVASCVAIARVDGVAGVGDGKKGSD